MSNEEQVTGADENTAEPSDNGVETAQPVAPETPTDAAHTPDGPSQNDSGNATDESGPTDAADQTGAANAPAEKNPVEDAAATAALTAALEPHLDWFGQLPNPLGDEELQQLLTLAAQLPEAVLQVSRNKSAGLAGEMLNLARLLKAANHLDARRKMLEDCVATIGRLSAKRTADIVTAQKLLRQLKSEIGWPQEAPVAPLYATLLTAETSLEQVVNQNRHFQADLLVTTQALAQELREKMHAGDSTEANAMWDRIQGNISNLSSRTQSELKEQIGELRSQINELREWKKFAAAEKKKELITQMRALLESEVPPPEKAGQIRKLHESWKLLGFSEQNEELWQEFKQVSDQAYAPCKEHFKQQKNMMAENLKQRTAICDRLEQFLATVDTGSPKIVELKQLESQAQDEWKKYAPVEQSKIKKLQKRFYGLLDQIRGIRRAAAEANGELKKALVQQAGELVSMEDRGAAIERAKALQTDWKNIGPTFFKDDRKYWEEFRAACDALFKERDQARKASRSEAEDGLKASTEILHRLEQLLELEEAALRDSRALFAALQRDFQQALSPKLRKQRQQLMDRFTALTRKIESRFRRLPDKKQVQVLAALEAKSTACLALEQRLSGCADSDALRGAIADFDKDAWQQQDSCGIEDFDQRMAARLDALLGVGSPAQWQQLVTNTEQQARRQLVEAEIRANLESPAQDRSLRMELQLKQLQSSFGKATLEDAGNRERAARHFQLAVLCTGPLTPAVREEYQQRAVRILDRLL